MKILVCGGRNFADVKRTKPTTEDEPPEVKETLRQYQFVQKELFRLTIQHSKEYNPNDNWLPTDIVIIEGGARGVDSAAADFAKVIIAN